MSCLPSAEDVKSLTGFEGSQGWAEGNGCLPVSLSDESTGKEVKVDFDNIDKMTRIQSNILSMGKLMRAGWDFHLTNFGDECTAVGPGGAYIVRCHLGVDDILRLPHRMRVSDDVRPLLAALTRDTNPAGDTTFSSNNVQDSQSLVYTLRRPANSVTYSFLHSVFNHCGDERLYHTLGNTRGYTQVRIQPEHCNTCAIAKARNFGLRQKTLNDTIPEGYPINPVQYAGRNAQDDASQCVPSAASY